MSKEPDIAEVNTRERFQTRECNIEGRVFLIDLLSMTNGCFVSISEGQAPRMGAISLCVRSDRGSSSSSLIPDRRGSMFGGMIGELAAERSGGIAVTSLHLREDLDPSAMKILLNAVKELVA